MKKYIVIASVLALVVTLGLLVNLDSGTSQPESTPTRKKPNQVIVLLDLSDRIIPSGQIESDKKLIQKVFQEFLKTVRYNLVMNSKDRFQICIAPQKNQSFDMDMESDKLTLDLSEIKVADKLGQIKTFEATLSKKLDLLYEKANKGSETKDYEGSNIWQFFNETLASLTNKEVNTKLVVVTDGYFDFEQNNAELSSGGLSTTTEFIKKLEVLERPWKEEIKIKGYGILPINHQLVNLSVCVTEMRSKNDMHLEELEMLEHIWENWLLSNGIPKKDFKTIYHSSASSNQLAEFLTGNN